jgi:hypothetical protein
MALKAASHKRRYCMSCGFDGETQSLTCPQCNKLLRSTTETRIAGTLQTFAGVLLIGLMAFIGQWIYGSIHSGEQSGGGRFTGSDQQLMIIFGIVGLVMLFGVVSSLAGLWQLATGKRNKVFIYLVALIGLVLAAAAIYVIVYF